MEMFPLKAWFKRDKKPALIDELTEEAALLTRDIVLRELALIEDRARVQAQREKRVYLLNWVRDGLANDEVRRDIFPRDSAL